MKITKDMPEHSRPREKLQERGASALTDEELVAAILGRGIKGFLILTHEAARDPLPPWPAS